MRISQQEQGFTEFHWECTATARERNRECDGLPYIVGEKQRVKPEKAFYIGPPKTGLSDKTLRFPASALHPSVLELREHKTNI